MLTYELHLNEIVLDFYERLKSVFGAGLRSLDYHLAGYSESDLIKLEFWWAASQWMQLALSHSP